MNTGLHIRIAEVQAFRGSRAHCYSPFCLVFDEVTAHDVYWGALGIEMSHFGYR